MEPVDYHTDRPGTAAKPSARATRLADGSLTCAGLLVALMVSLSVPLHPQTSAPRRPADPPCVDNANRYVDCGNGTVTDTVTGLVWLRDASCWGTLDWAAANVRAMTLSDGHCGLTDGSRVGQWRLPTVTEWRSTIARAVTLGCTTPGRGVPPTLTNTPGTACLSERPSPFVGVMGGYWTMTTDERHPDNAWAVTLDDTVHGHSYIALKSFTLPAWPVRAW